MTIDAVHSRTRPLVALGISAIVMLLLTLAPPVPETAAQIPSTNLSGYGVKVFRVESGLYPFVQVYVRTFDQEKNPLMNLNELNIGLMVKGRSYDPAKRQYRVESIRDRNEAIRSVLVLDASLSMRGRPFEEALKATARYIDSKRPQDQIAVLAVRDTKEGYELISNFERDPGALGRRLADIRCDGKKTRLYDAIGAAMQLSVMVPQGGGGIEGLEPIASTSIVVFSDGKDEESAISREELNARITALPIPIPIYSIAYSTTGREHFKNLEALSKNSFGSYFDVGESFDHMQRVVESIQNVLQNDYVVTFRSYTPVDGSEHALKVGVEYPSRSGRVTYESTRFEAIEPPPLEPVRARRAVLGQVLTKLPDGNPYLNSIDAQEPAPGSGGA